MKTDLCDTLGISIPILNAPMGGGAAGPELAAAVANAGGLGLLGLIALPPSFVPAMIARTRELTDRPFGAGVVLAADFASQQIEACLAARVPLLVLFWGDPTPWVAKARAAGTRIAAQIGSLDEGLAAARAGVDLVIAQGVEAGGHVRGTTPLAELLAALVPAVRPVPVIAAGGIATGADVARTLRLGAQAAMLGTRFLATDECAVADGYKQRVVAADAADTVLSSLFDIGWPDAPHRAIRNRVVREWEAAGCPPSGRRPGEGETIGRITLAGHTIDVPRYTVVPPLKGFEGDIEDFVLYAGESCSRVDSIKPAATIVAELAREIEAA